MNYIGAGGRIHFYWDTAPLRRRARNEKHTSGALLDALRVSDTWARISRK